MSWIQHSETPFLLAQKAVIDPSNWTDSYRDGQKLRQEYDARQQTKALNEIMKIGDHNGRLDAARQHKYAGALVPELQKYDEARQKAALDNLKASADIGKTYGEMGKLGAETGKIGAETGEIGVKTQNNVLEGLIKKYEQISAGALTQNPQYFALMLGDFENQGLINPDQKGMIIDMIMKDPQSAAAVMQGIARGSIEGFKATAPQVQSTNLGDRYGMTRFDPQTGQVTGLGDFTIGQSANNVADNAGRYQVAGLNNQSREAVADLQSRTSIYSTDANNQSRQGIANENLAVDWYKAQTGASVAQANAQTSRINANNKAATGAAGSTGNKPRPVAATKEMNKHLTNIRNNAHTIKTSAMWIKRIENGELELGGMANNMNALANRTGFNSLGKNPAMFAEFKANMTKLASDALRLNSGVQTDMDYKRALEEMQAGTYMPRNNQTAVALLKKIVKDFNVKTASEYASYADYKREYDGVSLPAYGHTTKNKDKKNTSKPASTGDAIIGGILGGK